uniref:hypothetical protein n=1 Tax=Prevotella sp. TaxID=59823 RepID=UPI004028085E
MRTIKLMANAAKGLMLAAFMAVGTTTVNAQNESAETFAPVKVGDWVKGEEVTGNGQEVYIYNVGAGTFISGKSATETDITKAYSWKVNETSPYTFACNNSTADRISMGYSKWTRSWSSEIKEKSGASDFTLIAGTTDKSYKFSITTDVFINSYSLKTKKETRYFNIDGSSYTATTTPSTYNDWLFISTKQKDAYVDYVNSFNEVDSYLTNEKVEKEENLLAKIKEVLTTVSNVGHSFSTYAGEDGDKVKLTGILEEIKNFLNTPTGIETIKPTTGKAKAETIYDVNGVRQNNLTKGINIVKMSDGTTKKIIK